MRFVCSSILNAAVMALGLLLLLALPVLLPYRCCWPVPPTSLGEFTSPAAHLYRLGGSKMVASLSPSWLASAPMALFGFGCICLVLLVKVGCFALSLINV